jgi:hypothetical protein
MGPLALLISVLVTGLLALPAFLIGLLLARLTRERPWRVPLWLGLALLSLVLAGWLALYGLQALVVAQLSEVVRQARLHQEDVTAWNWTRLRACTWPVWLRTLPLAPVVAAWRAIEARFAREGAATLHEQERSRQRAVTRAQHKASRRLHRHQVPASVQGQMVMGIPIDDEANA